MFYLLSTFTSLALFNLRKFSMFHEWVVGILHKVMLIGASAMFYMLTFFFKISCCYLRGMIPWLTNSSLVLLCCSFSWRTEHRDRYRQKEEEETKVCHRRMNGLHCQTDNTSSLCLFPGIESHKSSDITHNIGASLKKKTSNKNACEWSMAAIKVIMVYCYMEGTLQRGFYVPC